MGFRISGLDPAPFQPLFGLSEKELAACGAVRFEADDAGYPDRIELRDALPGETVILVNHTHQPADTPYRASHAVFVREGATKAHECLDDVPAMLRSRLLSIRAFDTGDMMIEADIVEGTELRDAIERFFDNPAVAYIHAHFARRGCYAARIDRSLTRTP